MENLCEGCVLFEYYNLCESKKECIIIKAGLGVVCPCNTCLVKSTCREVCPKFKQCYEKAKQKLVKSHGNISSLEKLGG